MKISVFLINQNVSLAHLEQILSSIPGRKVVCATHGLFDREIESLSTVALSNTEFFCVADFFSDSELSLIDEIASETVHEIQNKPGQWGYERFRNAMLSIKALRLLDALIAQFGDVQVWFASGLGWPEKIQHSRVEFVKEIQLAHPVEKRKKRSLLSKVVNRWRISSNWRELSIGKEKLVVFSKISRVSSRMIEVIASPVTAWRRAIIVFSNFRFYPYSKAWLPASTIHEYIRFGGRRAVVLQDGYLPSNYPESYLWDFDNSSHFVPSNPFSEKWFSRFSREVFRLRGFRDPEMKYVSNVRSDFRNVLVVLGHAGDWSALINRSDTCKLVRSTEVIARNLEKHSFCIRPHPTMTHSDHEGVESLNRILVEVNSWRLANCKISSQALDEDLAWADIVVSEYSQVLIDAIRLGKVGVIYNPTKRRSFMADYEELGFITAQSLDHLNELLGRNPDELVDRQNKAVKNFNNLLSNWENGADYVEF